MKKLYEPGEKPLENAKWERFAIIYAGDPKHNASEAARSAGYSVKTAYSIAHENLNRPEISARIAYLQRQTFKKLQMEADENLALLAQRARVDILDLLPKGDRDLLPEGADGRLIKSVHVSDPESGRSIKITTHDALKAQELLARHQGLITGEIQQQTNIAVVLQQIREDAGPLEPVSPKKLFAVEVHTNGVSGTNGTKEK